MSSKIKKIKKYAKGRAIEYEVKRIFEENGWIVTRSAASKGPWDLVAVKITPKNKKVVYMVCLMQVKSRGRK